MTELLSNIETHKRDQENSGLNEIKIAGLIGVLMTATITRYLQHPTNFIEYLPSLFGSIPTAGIAAGIVDRAERNS